MTRGLPAPNKMVHIAGAGMHECVAFLVTGLDYGPGKPDALLGVIYDDDPHPAMVGAEASRWHYPPECPNAKRDSHGA